ncbi:hypothetical protein PFISCL1PPCAC_4111, partial [Pristionchus fissidentatus]
MPPTNRPRSRAPTPGPSRVVARPKATVVRKTKEREQCAVCYEDLTTKRVIKLKQCQHRFHRTCCISWLETRERLGGQTCPLCRKRARTILDDEIPDRQLEGVVAFGASGQPSRSRIADATRRLELSTEEAIDWLVEKNENDLEVVRAQEAVARSGRRSKVYKDDIKTELAKLTRRQEIYEEMKEVLRAGGMVDIDYELDEAEPWNIRREMLYISGEATMAQRDAQEMIFHNTGALAAPRSTASTTATTGRAASTASVAANTQRTNDAARRLLAESRALNNYENSVNIPLPPSQMPIDPEEPLYCTCNQVSYGEMVCCSNDECAIEWFHFQCMGMESGPPPGVSWYCPDC